MVTVEPVKEKMNTFEEEDEFIVRCVNIPRRLRRLLSGRTLGDNGRDLRREEYRSLKILSFRGSMAERDV